MLPEYKQIAAQAVLTQKNWDNLVAYLGDNFDLALATRFFYLTNPHSTHPFDYYVPDHLDFDNLPPQLTTTS